MSTDRRSFLRQSSALLLAPSLTGLVACSKEPGRTTSPERAPVRHAGIGEGGYGALVEAGPELALPPGFTYTVVSRSGQAMSDGILTPGAFDGMAAFALANGNMRLIRNHENRDLPFTARLKGARETAYDTRAGACVSSLELQLADDGTPRLVRDFISLNGTSINCAGGPTPWGSWLTCEETTHGKQMGWEQEHGYIFEIPATAERAVQAVPLKAMGRFVHEAVAVDPETGIVYETEDRQICGFYRFLPNERGVLQAGGTLQMLAITGRENYDTADGQVVGEALPVHWVEIANPDPGALWGEDNNVYAQGFTLGGARFSRLEGCWYGDRSIYFHATNGGDARLGQVALSTRQHGERWRDTHTRLRVAVGRRAQRPRQHRREPTGRDRDLRGQHRPLRARSHPGRCHFRRREEHRQPHRVRRGVLQPRRSDPLREHHGIHRRCGRGPGDDAGHSRAVGEGGAVGFAWSRQRARQQLASRAEYCVSSYHRKFACRKSGSPSRSIP